MSEQRIDTGAEAATSTDADPGEGQGVADPGAHADPLDPQGHRTSGDDSEMPQPTADRPGAMPGADGSADSEGASALQEAQQTAGAQAEPDLGGREPAGSGVDQPSTGSGSGLDRPATGSGSGPGGARPAHTEAGEVSARPAPERRAEDPGSMATEFGDRAGSAPDDDGARPSI
jgi:hypothetical protein